MKATTDKYKQTFKPGDFEKKWQSVWERDGIYQPDLKKANGVIKTKDNRAISEAGVGFTCLEKR